MKSLFSQARAFSLLAAVFLAAGCTKENPQFKLPLLQDIQKIISTRPSDEDQIMAVIKLKSPALLSNTVIEDGQRKINPTLLKQITQEQEVAITELKKLSADVQVLFRYKYVLNAIAIVGPKSIQAHLSDIGVVDRWEQASSFQRPKQVDLELDKKVAVLSQRNSLKFIGAEKLHLLGLTGKGMTVGVLDTGIDYTHKMLGGVGTVEAYKAIDPAKDAVGYPNDKVVGGIDLVGTDYDSGSADFMFRVPRPDMNPLDEGGHGTHVAGTIAGIGDGMNSYDGMAKDASLYAIKVFGADGSTSDMVVIAGLEYSADPNGDGDLRDQLDVVNLSLGSGYGNPKILYAEAVKNLVVGGTIAVMSAGNSGAKDYIVGAPGTSTEALSVAASIDDGDHNWKFPASEIKIQDRSILVEAIEAATTKPIAEAGVVGSFYYIGLADKELTAEQKAQLNGKIALIDRGVVNFNDKVKRAAEGGAIGVVVANNREGAAFKMGTTDVFNIPAIMVTVQVGAQIKTALSKNIPVQMSFASAAQIEKPELIDRLTDFSSKGPRSIDGYLKPEISAPGSDIISAQMGGGAAIVKMSGTSMAAPHMAGVMAIVKQALVKRGLNLTALEMKNIAMGTAVTIGENGQRYPVTRQGSGRVRADAAAEAIVVADIPSISFGELNIESKKSLRQSVTIKNISESDLTLKVQFQGNAFITMNPSKDLVIKKSESATTSLLFNLDATLMQDETIREMDGWVQLMLNGQEVYRIPVLAVAHRMSAITASGLSVMSSAKDAQGAAAELNLSNLNQNLGEALLFNLVATDDRKPLAGISKNADCDMQSVGYRVIQKENQNGQKVPFIQFGIKTYKPMTTWNSCDVSLLIDQDGDRKPEQELLGATAQSVPGLEGTDFATTLIDFNKARQIRLAYEAELNKIKETYKNDPIQLAIELAKMKGKEDYKEAVLDQQGMQVYNNSTVLVLEAELSQLSVASFDELQIQVVMTHNENSTVQMDDYLAGSNDKWLTISVNSQEQSFVNLPESVQLVGGQATTVELTKGLSDSALLVLFPQNKMSFSDNVEDSQSQILKPTYQYQH